MAKGDSAGDFSADAEAFRQGQAGMSDEQKKLPRASSGGVIGSTSGMPKDPGPDSCMQDTAKAEFERLDQWDKPQAGTWANEPDEERDDD